MVPSIVNDEIVEALTGTSTHKVELGVMTIKGFSTFSKAPGLEHQHQMV